MHCDWEALSRGVYRCRLAYLDVTVGLVRGDAKTLLIDCGTTLSEANWIAEDVGELTGGVVTDVVMTHHHFDHILSSSGFGTAVLYSPAAVAEALTTRIDEVRAHALQYGADPGRVTGQSPGYGAVVDAPFVRA
jgi:glyoxylase-like metal-dependent hydrolase (beta-lactamase superfamily II)